MLNISSTNIGLESVTMIATSSLFDEHKILSSLDLLKLSEESKKKLAEIGLKSLLWMIKGNVYISFR